jgi:deoxycytidine triphosphate deaminase
MILGPKKLLELVKNEKLVTGLAERELANPEGAGFDLRLGAVHKIVGGTAFLGEEERQTPEFETILKYSQKKKQAITIFPNEFFLASTIESVNLPVDLTANFKPRTTTFRSGLFLRTGNVAPGYNGALTFALKNEGPLPVTIELGARIIHIQFEWVDGGGSMYRGQWQGGRVAATKKEKQV